ncbi:myosin-11-like [Cloeon dipterum]|uniref:myosin-11-like n=1 Tax=Cloeon dipterum TaxID=197152 RepID=UPI00321FBCEF
MDAGKAMLDEPLKIILHNDHCPEVCAVVVNRVFGRNERLRQELLEQLDQIVAASESITQLKILEIGLKKQIQDLEEDKKALEEDKKALEEKLESVNMGNEEKYLAKLKEKGLEHQSVISELEVRISTLEKEKANLMIEAKNLKNGFDGLKHQCEQLSEKNSQLEILSAKQDNEADFDERYEQLGIDLHQQQKLDEIQEKMKLLGVWEQQMELQEKEMQRLRETNRALRYDLKRPNHKPEINKLKIELSDCKAREEDLRSQLYRTNKELSELRKNAHSHNLALIRRNTLQN